MSLSSLLQSEFIRRQLAAQAEVVRLLDVNDARDRQAALFVHLAHAAEAGGSDGAAVVGILSANDDLFVRLIRQVPVAAQQSDHRVVRLRS
jgi:hypothetical protein